jgi:hypothetical protein
MPIITSNTINYYYTSNHFLGIGRRTSLDEKACIMHTLFVCVCVCVCVCVSFFYYFIIHMCIQGLGHFFPHPHPLP